MPQNESRSLSHAGVKGMKWGVRKDENSVASRKTSRMAKKDAARFADAKMFYGETAGTRRKLLKAELEKKRKTIPGYEKEFNKHLEKADFAKSAKKAVFKRKSIDTAKTTRSTIKQVLGVTGPLTIAAGAALYAANKPAVDAFVSRQFKNVAGAFKKGGGYTWKYKVV